jgi:hypothetical protein
LGGAVVVEPPLDLVPDAGAVVEVVVDVGVAFVPWLAVVVVVVDSLVLDPPVPVAGAVVVVEVDPVEEDAAVPSSDWALDSSC